MSSADDTIQRDPDVSDSDATLRVLLTSLCCGGRKPTSSICNVMLELPWRTRTARHDLSCVAEMQQQVPSVQGYTTARKSTRELTWPRGWT